MDAGAARRGLSARGDPRAGRAVTGRRPGEPAERADCSAAWTTTPRRITQYDDAVDLARAGDVTGPGGAPFGAAGFIVDCLIIALVN